MHYNIIAVMDSPNKNDIQIINKVIYSVFNTKPVAILDINTTSPYIFPWIKQNLLVFGQSAYSILQKEEDYASKHFQHIELIPDPIKLLDLPENGGTREYTWNTLETLKNKIDLEVEDEQDITLTKESLLSLDKKEMQYLDKNSKNTWTGKTKDGLTVTIGDKYPDKGSGDIQLTFTELAALKVAMELLEIEEFHLVPNTKNSH